MCIRDSCSGMLKSISHSPVLREAKSSLNEDVVALDKPLVSLSSVVKVQLVEALDMRITPESAVLA
eukprot:187764-Amphidinium_carterae.1